MSSEPWVALVSALISGVSVKAVDHFYIAREKRFDDAVTIRQELRAEVRGLNQQLRTLQQELDGWKDRYYELTSRYQTLVSECQHLRMEVEALREHDDLRAYQQVQHLLRELREPPAAADQGSS